MSNLIGCIKVCANKVHNSDLSVNFTVRWTDEDNCIIQYIENNTWVPGNSKAL